MIRPTRKCLTCGSKVTGKRLYCGERNVEGTCSNNRAKEINKGATRRYSTKRLRKDLSDIQRKYRRERLEVSRCDANLLP